MDDIAILHTIWDELSARGLVVHGCSAIRPSYVWRNTSRPMIVIREFLYIEICQGDLQISYKGVVGEKSVAIHDNFCLSDPECLEMVFQKIQKLK